MRYAFLLPVAGLLAALTPSAAFAQAAKFATINPVTVFNKMAETQDVKARMDAEDKTLKAVGEEKLKKLRQLAEQLKDIRRDAPAFAEKSRELRAAQIEAEAWDKLTKSDVDASKRDQTLAVFKKIDAAVAEVAKAKGIDLVLADTSSALPESVDGVTSQQFTQFLSQRSVLFSGGTADITEEVLAKLDAAYKSGTPASATPTAAPAPTTPMP